MDVRCADQTILDLERSVLDGDCCLAIFRTFKGEMEGGVEAARLIWLEDVRHEVKQSGDGARAQAIGYGFDRLVLKFAVGHSFCIGARYDIDRLSAFLQRSDHFLKVAFFVIQIGADHILSGRANSHAIGRFVIGAMA